MKTKVCNRCNERKPIQRFNQKRASGVQPYCRPCQGAYQRRYYQKDKRAQLLKMYANRRRRKNELYSFFTKFFAKNPCVDCAKEKRQVRKLLKGKVPTSTINKVLSIMDSDIRSLTFDHISQRGEKHFNIADMIRDIRPIHRIESEIKKCVVRCHNHHDIITAKRSRNWRYRAYKQLTK